MINNKEQIIKYFEDGIKEEGNLKIGVEHEKFIFNKKDDKRIDYSSIIKMFDHLYEFGWKPVEDAEPLTLPSVERLPDASIVILVVPPTLKFICVVSALR